MSLEITIFAIVLAGAMAVFVLFPVLERQPEPEPDRLMVGGTRRQRQTLDMLRAEKLRTLRAIRDLDFDYDLSKLTNESYVTQRVHLIRIAVAITERIDDLEADVYAQQARIEAALADFRAAR
jgi:hypothetical protein